MLDKDGIVIYVGKARVLKNRVRQYFHSSQKSEKVAAMVENIADFYYIITQTEIDALAFSGRLITLTIGIRFLTDYLAGDTYFRTAYEDHNLVRCRTQLKMVQSMEDQCDEYERIVRENAN